MPDIAVQLQLILANLVMFGNNHSGHGPSINAAIGVYVCVHRFDVIALDIDYDLRGMGIHRDAHVARTQTTAADGDETAVADGHTLRETQERSGRRDHARICP